MKLCHSCDETNFFFTKTEPNERCNYLVKNTDINLQVCHPKNSDIEMILETQDFTPGTKIMYWAAEPVPLVRSKTIKNSDEAYKIEKTKNYGITKCRKDNKICFKICAPRCYKEYRTLWPKHLHFVVSDGKKWIDHMYTVLCLPVETRFLTSKKLKYSNIYVTPMQVKVNWKKNNFYMVYALDEPYKSLKDIDEYSNLNHLRIPWDSIAVKIPSKVKKETPLVVYCKSSKCNAGKKLILRLATMGYENLYYMEEGMEGFSKASNKLIA
jgi:rhodanese-related sulfurtransferase